MLDRAGAWNKTQKRRKRKPFANSSRRPSYLKAGMATENFTDDSGGVNVRAWMPTAWVETGMVLLNFAVWLEAGARLAGSIHPA